jgi:hypothetical protein
MASTACSVNFGTRWTSALLATTVLSFPTAQDQLLAMTYDKILSEKFARREVKVIR